MTHFLQEIRAIFGNPSLMPKGKFILSYRKEYHPEMEEVCKNQQILREKIFLRNLEQVPLSTSPAFPAMDMRSATAIQLPD